MAWDTHLHVCMPCDDNSLIAELADQHVVASHDRSAPMYEPCKKYLLSLSNRTGPNLGGKGGLSLWGQVGNHWNGETFCETLRDFWTDVLKQGGDDASPMTFEHILVFFEEEQSEAATAFEIYLVDNEDPQSPLEIKRHSNLPFTWMQF